MSTRPNVEAAPVRLSRRRSRWLLLAASAVALILATPGTQRADDGDGPPDPLAPLVPDDSKTKQGKRKAVLTFTYEKTVQEDWKDLPKVAGDSKATYRGTWRLSGQIVFEVRDSAGLDDEVLTIHKPGPNQPKTLRVPRSVSLIGYGDVGDCRVLSVRGRASVAIRDKRHHHAMNAFGPPAPRWVLERYITVEGSSALPFGKDVLGPSFNGYSNDLEKNFGFGMYLPCPCDETTTRERWTNRLKFEGTETTTDKTTESFQIAFPQQGEKFNLTVACYDYGAYGDISFRAPVKVRIEGHDDRITLDLPKDENDNHVADAWEKAEGIYDKKLPADWDEVDMPGHRAKGDGICLYERYRGFATRDDAHVQLKPTVKYVFIRGAENIMGPWGADTLFRVASSTTPLFIKPDQWTGPGSQTGKKWIVNFNYEGMPNGGPLHKVDQHAIHLASGAISQFNQDADPPPGWAAAYAKSGLRPPPGESEPPLGNTWRDCVASEDLICSPLDVFEVTLYPAAMQRRELCCLDFDIECLCLRDLLESGNPNSWESGRLVLFLMRPVAGLLGGSSHAGVFHGDVQAPQQGSGRGRARAATNGQAHLPQDQGRKVFLAMLVRPEVDGVVCLYLGKAQSPQERHVVAHADQELTAASEDRRQEIVAHESGVGHQQGPRRQKAQQVSQVVPLAVRAGSDPKGPG